MGCDLGQGFHFSEPLPQNVLRASWRGFPHSLDDGGREAIRWRLATPGHLAPRTPQALHRGPSSSSTLPAALCPRQRHALDGCFIRPDRQRLRDKIHSRPYQASGRGVTRTSREDLRRMTSGPPPLLTTSRNQQTEPEKVTWRLRGRRAGDSSPMASKTSPQVRCHSYETGRRLRSCCHPE